ncbi:response regulator transcription factor [Ensifer soli]|uniref:response regulator transcription factor n=1 Tax=Ciceribacter sp. sgz301302 TaxID=3342379 RepID=UPI0035B89886
MTTAGSRAIADGSERTGIVVVEDDPDLRDTVVDYLRMRAFDVEGLGDGASLRALFTAAAPPALVLLDIDLPGENGLSLCRWLKRESRARVILATGAAQPLDRIVGLEAGADAYVVKPYDLRELVARIRALLRRPAAAPLRDPAPAAVDERPGLMMLGPHRLDRAGRRLTDAAGNDLGLTPAEFALACLFAERPNRILSRAVLCGALRERGPGPGDRAVDVTVARLRRKIETEAAPARLIVTVRNEGYRYEIHSMREFRSRDGG